VGPVGRSIGSDVSAGDRGHTHAFSYAMSQGLFFGASLEATVIASRVDVNRNFYGESVSASALLSGEYPRPKGAEPLYKQLDALLAMSSAPPLPQPTYEQPATRQVANKNAVSPVHNGGNNYDSFVSAPTSRPVPPGRAPSGKYANKFDSNGDIIGLDSAEEFGLGGASV
jgi:hypothetical protein